MLAAGKIENQELSPKNTKLALVPPKKSSNKNPLLLSLLLILASALIAGIVWVQLDQSEEVVVAKRQIEQGSVIQADDLTLRKINGNVNKISSLNLAIGQLATSDIKSGDIVSPNDIASTLNISANKAIIGVVLGPGQYPITGIRSGDVVDIFQALPTGTSQLIATNVSVYNVASAGDSGSDLLFSFAVDLSETKAVTGAAALQDGMRITLKGSQ